MIRRPLIIPVLLSLLLFAAGCRSGPEIPIETAALALQFSGDRAYADVADFVGRFPNRDSGQPNNAAAAAWLLESMQTRGLACSRDDWEVINYSRPLPLRNVVCERPGRSTGQIVLVAHFDQSPDTIEGADNDGSGMAILLQLAEIFAREETPAHTLVFLAADGEEYGMLGSRRYVQTHVEPGRIIAAISLDNLGKGFYDGLDLDPRGQFRGYGPLWLLRLSQAAAAAGGVWVPRIPGVVDQILGQAVPISFMDEGPFVAAGIPAFGLAGHVPAAFAERHWETYHSPEDRIEVLSAPVLEQSGRAAEAAVRWLLGMTSFPLETGPYLYFAESDQVLRGWPLWTIFVVFVGLFFLGGARSAVWLAATESRAWWPAVAHLLSFWLPLLAAILLLYGLVEVGMMDKYHLYPATPRDEPLFEPRWGAVIIWLAGLAAFLWGSRRLAGRYLPRPDSFASVRAAALTTIGLAGLYVLLTNPFSLLFMVPLLFWFLIGGRTGRGRGLDALFFLLGGLVVYVLFYFFGFVILRNNLAVLWYLMMMFSIRMIGFPTAAAIAAILAAGLAIMGYGVGTGGENSG